MSTQSCELVNECESMECQCVDEKAIFSLIDELRSKSPAIGILEINKFLSKIFCIGIDLKHLINLREIVAFFIEITPTMISVFDDHVFQDSKMCNEVFTGLGYKPNSIFPIYVMISALKYIVDACQELITDDEKDKTEQFELLKSLYERCENYLGSDHKKIQCNEVHCHDKFKFLDNFGDFSVPPRDHEWWY